MHQLFVSSWSRAWQGLGGAGYGTALRDALLSRYAEPHRKYHTTQHLEECLANFESVRQAADRPAEVEVALWFHDAIYEPRAHDNEDRSAAWAHAELLAGGVECDSAGRVRDLVLATRHTGVPRTADEKVLVDVDLAVLGASDDRFAEYERQIRDEYAFVPELIFRLKRRAVLQSFLDRPSIFSTPELHRKLEARARSNLARAVGNSAASR